MRNVRVRLCACVALVISIVIAPIAVATASAAIVPPRSTAAAVGNWVHAPHLVRVHRHYLKLRRVRTQTPTLGSTDVRLARANSHSALAPATPSPVIDVSGIITGKQVWSPAYATSYVIVGSVTIASGASLYVAPGTVVKSYGAGTPCEGGLDANLCVRGILYAIGTSNRPVTFTSLNDNSVGGSTGEGVVEPGDWSGIGLQPGSASFLVDAAVNYAQVGLEGATPGRPYWAAVSGDAFANEVGAAVILQGVDNPLVENNSATDPGVDSYAYDVSSSELNFARLFGNTSTGGVANDFAVSGVVGTDSKMADQPIPWLLTGTLFVPGGSWLSIAPGTVIKSYGAGAPCEGGLDENLCVRGILYAIGTTAAPITFTSINDNSVGGSTGLGVAEPGDWSGIGLQPGSASFVEHVVASYAQVGIEGAATSSPYWATIESDQFANEVGAAVVLVNPRGAFVENNAATNPGVDAFAYFVGSGYLNFGGLVGNTASGTGTPDFAVAGTALTSTMTNEAIPWYVDSSVAVPVGATLTVAPGTVVKSYGAGAPCESEEDANVCVFGQLVATGSTGAPVTFTSINDNSVGGSTGIEVPVPGDWGGIGVAPGGSVDAQGDVLDWAYTAVGLATSVGGSNVVDANTFANDETGLAIASVTGSTTQAENNTFSNDEVAMDATSTWSTLAPDPASCGYVPYVEATGNSFLTSGDVLSTTPLVTPADYSIITGGTLPTVYGVPSVQDYPPNWASAVQPSTTDTVVVTYQPCDDGTNPSDSYVAVATPLDLGGAL